MQQHRLRHEVLTGQQVNARFPGFRLPPAMPALFQPDGGILLPEDIVKVMLRNSPDWDTVTTNLEDAANTGAEPCHLHEPLP